MYLATPKYNFTIKTNFAGIKFFYYVHNHLLQIQNNLLFLTNYLYRTNNSLKKCVVKIYFKNM